MKKSNRQQGMSLIELMIAMVVSLVLIGGVGTVYVSSKRSYQARDQLSLMGESARVALEALTKHLEHAGYATPAKLPLGNYMYVKGDANPPVAACGGSDTGVHASLPLTTFAARATQDDYKPDGVNPSGDAISVRFIGDDSLFSDCANGVLPTSCRAGVGPSMEAGLIYNTFFVNVSGGQPSLMCSGSRNVAAVPVVPGVEHIQFMYGVDANSDSTVDKYVNASTVGAGEWQQVVSIKIAILVRSQEPVLPEAPSTATSYQLLDKTVTPAADRFQRAVYTAVVHLRNVVSG